MVATRRQRADGQSVADTTSKPASKTEGIKAPARRGGRPKKAVEEKPEEPQAPEPAAAKPAAQKPTTTTRTTTRSRRNVTEPEEQKETEQEVAPVVATRTSRSKAAPSVETKAKETKTTSKATEKKPATTRTRKVVVTVIKSAEPVEPSKDEEEGEEPKKTARATRSTASARARQAPVQKEPKSRTTKAKLPRSGPVKKTVPVKRKAAEEEEVVDLHVFDNVNGQSSEMPRDDSPEPEGMAGGDVANLEEDETLHDMPRETSEPIEPIDEKMDVEPESVEICQPIESTPASVVSAKRESESRIPSPKRMKLDHEASPQRATASLTDSQLTTSPFKSSSMTQAGISIGSPVRRAKTGKLMLTPARNRFGDWVKPAVPEESTRNARCVVTRPVTPPPTFEPTQNNLSLLNTCPGRVIAPPASCLRKIRPLQTVTEGESPKKTVTFTVKTPIATPKAEPVAGTSDEVEKAQSLAIFNTPGVADATPKVGFLGSILRTPKIFTPWTANKSKMPGTPGTVHWTWNPVTPAFQPPAVSPIKVASESVESSEGAEMAAEGEIAPAKDTVLKGVKCYVEVRWQSGSDGSSMFVSLLKELGAEISVNFAADTTHVLWGNGNLATLERVQMSGGEVQAVNLNWPME